MSRTLPEQTLAELLGHSRWVRSMVAGLAVDESEVDDWLQQTWVAALEHPPRHDGSLGGWLARVARNFSLLQRRGETRRQAREQRVASGEAVDSAAEVIEKADLHRKVVEAVWRLEEPYRSTLLLRFYEDLQPAEIARRTGVPAATVRTRLRRGLQRLRDDLLEEHGSTWLASCIATLAPQCLPGPAPAPAASSAPAPATSAAPAAAATAAPAVVLPLLALGLALIALPLLLLWHGGRQPRVRVPAAEHASAEPAGASGTPEAGAPAARTTDEPPVLRVQDGAGRAVAGAALWLDDAWDACGSSDAQGLLRLPRQPQELRARADGFLPYSGPYRNPLQLDPGGTLELQLLAPDGSPWPQAVDLELSCATRQQTLRSDAHGFLRSGGWPEEPIRVAANGRAGVLAVAPAIPSGSSSRLELAPATWRSGVLRGQVRRRGLPVAGAELSLEHGRERAASASSAADGTFALPYALTDFEPKAELWLLAQTADDAPCARLLNGPLEDELVLELVPGQALSGSVLAPEGVPAPAAAVVARAPGAPWQRTVATDAAGRFHLAGLPEGPLDLSASAAAGAAALRLERLPADGVRLLLQAPRTAGSQVQVDGRPAPARVRACAAGRPCDADADGWQATDGEGRFRLALAADDCLCVLAPGCAALAVPGDAVPPVLALASGGARAIQGTVQDAAGRPVQGARVRARAADGDRILETGTDGFGRFRFDCLAEGAYALTALARPLDSQREWHGAPLRVPAGARDVLLELPPLVLLRGRFLPDAGLGPAAAAEVEVLVDGQVEARALGSRGLETFFLYNPPLHVEAWLRVQPLAGSDLLPLSYGPYLLQEQTPELELPLRSGQPIRGRVTLPAGAGELQSAQVELRASAPYGAVQEHWQETVDCGRKGGFQLARAPLGAVSVHATARDADGRTYAAETVIQVEAGGALLELPLEPR